MSRFQVSQFMNPKNRVPFNVTQLPRARRLMLSDAFGYNNPFRGDEFTGSYQNVGNKFYTDNMGKFGKIGDYSDNQIPNPSYPNVSYFNIAAQKKNNNNNNNSSKFSALGSNRPNTFLEPNMRVPDPIITGGSNRPNTFVDPNIRVPTPLKQNTGEPTNKFGKGLLDFANTPFGKGFAQGLLQAGGYSPMPVSFGQALGQALQTAEQSVDRDFDKQQTEFMNQLRQSAEDREQRKFDAEISLIDQQVLDNEEVKGILKNTKLSDFDSDSDYYRSVANQLIQMGKTSEAAQFLELATPTSTKELRKDTLSANKDEGAVFKEVKKGITTYKQLTDALQQNDGTAAYAVMIKFIKQLDDSVVREGEVRNFVQFQGLFNTLKIEIEKAQGKGFPPETKAAIGNLANKTFTALIEDYSKYQNEKSTGLYNSIGMNPELVFSGYDVSQYSDDINRSFVSDDFSTDQMYDDYGSLADIKRRFDDVSDEDLAEYLKTADPLEVKHFINLGFINQ